MRKFKVIGPCEVGGVQPGGTVTEGQLVKHGATNIDALVGPHLEELTDDAPKDETKKTTK